MTDETVNTDTKKDPYTELEQKYNQLKIENEQLRAKVNELQQVQIHINAINEQLDTIIDRHECKQIISNPVDDADDYTPKQPSNPQDDVVIPDPSNPQEDDMNHIKVIAEPANNLEVGYAIRDDIVESLSSDEAMYRNNNPTDEIVTRNIKHTFDFETSAKDMIEVINKVYRDYVNIDSIDIYKALDDFLYLSNFHDDKFDEIYKKLRGECYFKECKIFKRINRDRGRYYKSKFNTAEYQILDKIHCYYAHSYDMSYRLTPDQKQQLQKMNNDNIDEKEIDDNKHIKFTHILSQNKSKHGICMPRIKKYSQFSFKQIDINDQKLYSF
eukprot:217273_1